jgi:hypothetical protein
MMKQRKVNRKRATYIEIETYNIESIMFSLVYTLPHTNSRTGLLCRYRPQILTMNRLLAHVYVSVCVFVLVLHFS